LTAIKKVASTLLLYLLAAPLVALFFLGTVLGAFKNTATAHRVSSFTRKNQDLL
jgi:hypothetical protein